MSIYFLNGRAKVELAVARGRKLHDKRQAMAERDSKLEMAKGLGATHTVNSAEDDPVQAIRSLTRNAGVDHAFEAVGNAVLVRQAIESLGIRGTATIVGVLHDGKYDRLDEGLHPLVYVPIAQWFVPSFTIHVRTSVEPRTLAEPVRNALVAVNVDLPSLQARTLEEHISASTFVPRTGTIVVSAFAAMVPP